LKPLYSYTLRQVRCISGLERNDHLRIITPYVMNIKVSPELRGATNEQRQGPSRHAQRRFHSHV
jgi:hypothetical protein